MTHKFLAVYCRVLVAIYLIPLGYRFLTGSGLLDRAGSPVGGDFLCYWVAASLALAGEPAAVYDFKRLAGAAQTGLGVALSYPWPYPPTFLLILLPLALLPYIFSLAVWLLTTMGAYLWIVRRIAPHPLTIWLTLAFPGTFQNFAHGQNGFLSSVLLGGGLLLVDRWPVAGGLLLGLLSYKPHLAVLVPLALLAGRRGRALLAAVAATLALALASILILGYEVWPAFFRSMPLAWGRLASGILPLDNMTTVSSAVLGAGGNLLVALIFQGLVMLGAGLAVVWVWARGASLAMRGSVLVLSTLLFTPHAFVYDLALLALPLAWLGWDAYHKGWGVKEQVLLILGWSLPLMAPIMAKLTRVPLAPVILALLLMLALKRSKG